MQTTTDQPSVTEARQALKQLEADLLARIKEYENRYDISIQKVELTHCLMLGYPRRVMNVLLSAIL